MDMHNLSDGIFGEFVHTLDMDSRCAYRPARPTPTRLTATDAEPAVNATLAKRFWANRRLDGSDRRISPAITLFPIGRHSGGMRGSGAIGWTDGRAGTRGRIGSPPPSSLRLVSGQSQ